MMAFTYVAQNVIKRFYRRRNPLALCSHPTIPIPIYQKLCVGKYNILVSFLKREGLHLIFASSFRYFIYGMQDAQHLERVRLEFNAFNIPKVEHKDKSE